MEYYYIKVKIQTEKTPPYFIGSMLRGAFGHALKRVTCINPSYKCNDCFESENCLYYNFYEKENQQHNYRFDVALGSDSFDFGLYLFSDACNGLAYILSSLEIALTKNGLGKERNTFDDIEIYVNGTTVYKNSAFVGSLNVATKKLQIDDYMQNIKIYFETPLRMKKSNKLEYNKIKVEYLLRSIYQRKKVIFENEEVYSLDYVPSYVTSVKALEYKPLYRRSDRQEKAIIMDGVLGEMAVIAIDKRSYELLKIGELIGVGKQTVFGLGKIRIEEL